MRSHHKLHNYILSHLCSLHCQVTVGSCAGKFSEFPHKQATQKHINVVSLMLQQCLKDLWMARGGTADSVLFYCLHRELMHKTIPTHWMLASNMGQCQIRHKWGNTCLHCLSDGAELSSLFISFQIHLWEHSGRKIMWKFWIFLNFQGPVIKNSLLEPSNLEMSVERQSNFKIIGIFVKSLFTSLVTQVHKTSHAHHSFVCW